MEIRGGVVPPGSPTCLDPISDKILFLFHTRFQTWPLKSIPFIRPGVARNYVIITCLVLIVNIYNIYN